MDKVLKNIRKNNIKGAIGMLIPAALLTGIFILILYMIIVEQEGFELWHLIILALFGLFGYFADAAFIKYIQLAINPLKSDIFKKYGSPDKIAKILNEIEKNKIYEDKYLVISKNYISDKKDYSKIVACNDVLGVHKLVHKTNFVIDYYQIVITDKYNQTTTYQYHSREKEKVDQLLMIIGSKCPNAELGYTQKEWKNINDNSISLPDEIKDDEEMFKCDNCGALVKANDKVCSNCHLKFDDEEENKEIKEIKEEVMNFKCDECGAYVHEDDTICPKCGASFDDGDIDEKNDKFDNADKKYDSLLKLKKLYDKEIITKEEFEKEKKKLLK